MRKKRLLRIVDMAWELLEESLLSARQPFE